MATVIASQSIISGAYSMTQQAISLGFLPRMKVVHTEGREIGQIYVPFVNWVLAAGTLTAVIGFGSSDALAGAFGIAVSLLMAITTLMATFVALHWKHNPLIVYAVNGSLLALDLLFFASTSIKLFDGGWFPLLIAFVISFLVLTWRKGEEVMDAVRLEIRQPSKAFIDELRRDPPHRIPGVAIVLGRMAKGVPLALSHNVKCNRVLQEHVLLVAVATTCGHASEPTHSAAQDPSRTSRPIAFGFSDMACSLSLAPLPGFRRWQGGSTAGPFQCRALIVIHRGRLWCPHLEKLQQLRDTLFGGGATLSRRGAQQQSRCPRLRASLAHDKLGHSSPLGRSGTPRTTGPFRQRDSGAAALVN